MSYQEEELTQKLTYYNSLPEKVRRHFLALEYARLGVGSQRYLAEVFGCSRNTITKGSRELVAHEGDSINYSRQRKAGAGRRKKST
mgnify:CR=1 FL=1